MYGQGARNASCKSRGGQGNKVIQQDIGSDRYGFFRHLQIKIICRFRFADISANADDLQIHAFIGRYGNKSADLRGYLQIFEDI